MIKLLISTTVPETLITILKGQPEYLSKYFEVELVTSSVVSIDNADYLVKGARLSSVDMTRGISPVSDIVSIFNMVRVLMRARPSIIHSYTPKAGLVCMVAGWLCRVPIRIHTFTGLIFPTESGFKQKLLLFADRLICIFATNVVPEGQGVRQDLKSFNVTTKPLQVIGYGNIAGVDTTHFSREDKVLLESGAVFKNGLGLKDRDFVFCYVGRLNRDKGLTELAAAFRTMPTNCHLVIVGALDETAPASSDTLDYFKGSDRVHLIGALSDVRGALMVSDVLVLPSYREGFPNVLLEAGSMGLPCIATDINGSNEIIKPGLNGWLVPAKDISSLASAMADALDSSGSELHEMGLRARERVEARFEKSAHWDRMVEYYKSLL